MTRRNTPNALSCPECKTAINAGARRCGSCGTELNKNARYFLRATQFIAAALVIVPLWEIAISTTDIFKTTVSFGIDVAGCGPNGIALSVVNAEKDKVIKWSEARLVSVNEIKVDEQMVFPPGQPRHIAPLSTANLTFFRQEDGGRTVGEVCATGCVMTVSLVAQEVDGSKVTTATATCNWTPEKPRLD